ncbi:hypothetical protein LY78DRAFT_18621 [Colletotrichum sublineola]|nr:hypothetical protein LY78DRAFT_18621 [Colletotrichum sublineola]
MYSQRHPLPPPYVLAPTSNRYVSTHNSANLSIIFGRAAHSGGSRGGCCHFTSQVAVPSHVPAVHSTTRIIFIQYILRNEIFRQQPKHAGGGDKSSAAHLLSTRLMSLDDTSCQGPWAFFPVSAQKLISESMAGNGKVVESAPEAHGLGWGGFARLYFLFCLIDVMCQYLPPWRPTRRWTGCSRFDAGDIPASGLSAHT